MNTAAKRHALDTAIGGAREWCARLEQVAVDVLDPKLIELSVIAGIALDLAGERARELEDDDADNDIEAVA